ncbi:MAG TPA: HTH domain-containing protein [Cyclobacteriaceae bacterium]|jgi:biotin operon repressor|nr:HTH domain-containing protein [Cyclobacteriaceae bacterium]
MSLLKYIDRLKRMDSLIKKEVTGTSNEFAEKLGISRSMLMENLNELKELGAEIAYCSYRRTYHYTNKFSIVIGAAETVTGGINFFRSPILPDTYGLL